MVPCWRASGFVTKSEQIGQMEDLTQLRMGRKSAPSKGFRQDEKSLEIKVLGSFDCSRMGRGWVVLLRNPNYYSPSTCRM